MPRPGQVHTSPCLAGTNARQADLAVSLLQRQSITSVKTQATAEEGDPVYEIENEEAEPWPQLENSEGILSDAPYTGQGWGMHFRHPDKPTRQIYELDLRRVADFLRSSHGLEYDEIKATSSGVVQMNFMSAPRGGKRSGCLQLYTTKLGTTKGNIRVNTGDRERVKILRSIFLRSAWFADATNELAPEGVAQESGGASKKKDKDKGKDIEKIKERVITDLDFASEDAELTPKHIEWLEKFPENELKTEELRLRTALFEFLAGWQGDSEATLGDLLADGIVLKNMQFFPKRFPLEAWVDRRIGTEMLFQDENGTRLGMSCQLVESNEEMLVPTMTP